VLAPQLKRNAVNRPNAETNLFGNLHNACSPLKLDTGGPQQAAVIATSESLLRSSQLRRFGHGLHFSRNARVIWSWKGLTRYETTVRGFVWMKTSTGMPGTSFNPFRRAISASDTLM
jgi:hypothetical protein